MGTYQGVNDLSNRTEPVSKKLRIFSMRRIGHIKSAKYPLKMQAFLWYLSDFAWL